MRRSLSSEVINYRRRGYNTESILYNPCISNDLPFQTSGSVSFDSSNGARLYSDGAYIEKRKIIPTGDFSFKFTFKASGRGSGADQYHFYLGDWDTYGSSYLVGYLRQYSSSDTYFAWAINQRVHYASTDGSVFYNCNKYNWHDTYGTWYQVHFEVINKSFIRIKVNQGWSGFHYPLSGTWDYAGPITNPAGFYPQNGNFGFCATLCDPANGFYICHINIDKLNWG